MKGAMKMKKVLVLATCMVLLLAGAAQAGVLQLGDDYTSIHGIWGSSHETWGGGSFEPSSWNGTPLEFVYCVDALHSLSSSGYNSASATTTGVVNGSLVHNAGQVAWLLDHFGTAGNGDEAYALQAAIWHVIYEGAGRHGTDKYNIDRTEHLDAVDLYDTMLLALGSKTADISGYLWITPGGNNCEKQQGLVASIRSVPEPGTFFLLGSGLLGLVAVGRKKFCK